MEEELHQLIREACGGWNDQATEIWNLIETQLNDRCKMLEDANDGWQAQHKKLQAAHKQRNEEKTLLVMRNSALQDVVVKLEREQEVEGCFEAAEKDKEIERLKSANRGLIRDRDHDRARLDTTPPNAVCAECADTVRLKDACWGPQGYVWCRRCFEGIECDHKGCSSHVSHPCEECGRRWCGAMLKAEPVLMCDHGRPGGIACPHCHGFATPECDHEFADTKSCVKCGWFPPPKVQAAFIISGRGLVFAFKGLEQSVAVGDKLVVNYQGALGEFEIMGVEMASTKPKDPGLVVKPLDDHARAIYENVERAGEIKATSMGAVVKRAVCSVCGKKGCEHLMVPEQVGTCAKCGYTGCSCKGEVFGE